MSFLYDIIADYEKSYDTVTDNGSAGTVTTLYGYLSSFDEVLFSQVSASLNEILTFGSIDDISDEYIHYLAYMLGYEWNFDLDYDLQRNLLKGILEVYKRKGTKFAFHFNLYRLDPSVQLYEPYKDLFIVDKSKFGEDHLPSEDYYSYGILVIKLNKFIPEIFDVIEYVRPAGWKIVVEFSYGIYYSFHIKVKTEERVLLENSSNLDFYLSRFNSRIESYKNIINTEGNVYSNTNVTVTRSLVGDMDNLSDYVYSDAIVEITKVYLNNETVFELGVDYTLNTNNTLVIWTPVGMTKIAPGEMYFIDYVNDDKIEAQHLLYIDEYIQETYIANSISDQYIYDEFNNPIFRKLTDAEYTEQYVNSLVYINGQYMPVTMVGHTFIPGMYQPSVYEVENDTERYNLVNLVQWYNTDTVGKVRLSDTQLEVMYNFTKDYVPGEKFKFNDSDVQATITDATYNTKISKTIFTVTFDDIITYKNGTNKYRLTNCTDGTSNGVLGYQVHKGYSLIYYENFGNTYSISADYLVTSVDSVYSVVGEVTTYYSEGSDYEVSGNDIIWTSTGNKPDSTFYVDFTYSYNPTNGTDYIIVNENGIYYIKFLSNNVPEDDTVFYVKYSHVLPTNIDKILVSSSWVSNGDLVYQKDTKQVYKVVDAMRLEREDSYTKLEYSLDIALNRSTIVLPLNSKFRLEDMGNHHMLYETDDNIYTLYRYSLQYSEYQLLNGDVFVEGGDKTIIIPNGVNEIYITTCGGGGGASSLYHIENNRLAISTGGGGGAVRYRYKLSVSPGDAIRIVGGLGGVATKDGEPSYAAIKKVNSTEFEIVTNTYADPGKSPTSLDDMEIPTAGLYGTSWYGGEAGGQYSGSGGSIWASNISFNSLNNTTSMEYVYSDYGNNGMSFGGKSITDAGLICGGGGSYGVGGGLEGVPGYGGGGCNSTIAGDGVGGVGFARIQYDANNIVDESNSPTKVTITPNSISLKVGEFAKLEYEITPIGDWPHSWYSYDESIVTVDSEGNCVAVGTGKTYVGVVSVIETGLCEVIVTENIVLVTNLSLFGDSTLPVGQIAHLTISILPSNATDKSVTITSSDSNIVAVNNEGTVMAVSPGEAVITAKTNDGSNLTATLNITIV